MAFAYIFAVFVLISTAIYLFLLNIFSYWKNRGVAHEEPHLFFGNSKNLGKTRSFDDLIKPLYDKYKGKEQFIGLYIFIKPAVVPINLDLIKNIFIKDFQYFSDRGLYVNERDDPLTAHLFLLDGQKWRSLRTKISPTFTSGKMKFMFSTILQVGKELENVLKRDVEKGKDLEIKDYLARFTTDVIGTCAFGIECNSLKDPNTEFRNYGKKLFEQPRHGPLVEGLIGTFPKLAKFFRMKLMHDDVENFFMNVVKQTVDYREKNDIKRNDFMNLLLEIKNNEENENGLTVEQIAAQVFLFFLAGYETSSTSMAYTLYELALNQDIQDKMRSEISKVLEKYDGELTYEAMKEMTYLDQVINESLRKYPVFPFLIRKTVKDYQVPGTELIIEKGLNVFIPVYAIHNDPDIYPNPENFDPDRFTAEECNKRHPCAFIPFGDGPRNCIGLRFGKMQICIALVALLKNFKFSVSSLTQIPLTFKKDGFILAAVGGIHLRVERI